ncbi:MAG: hypothetical protein AAF938_20385 [Myxococcota bacterium]
MLALLTSASAASAQDPLVEAREAHMAALAALEENDLEVAEEGFRRALRLGRRASSAYNLALVLIDRRQFTEARDLLRELLADEYGEAPVATGELQTLVRRAEAGQATLVLETNHGQAIEVEVSGVGGVLRADEALRLRLDPGPHRVEAAVPIETLEVELRSGQTHTHQVVLRAPEAPGPVRSEPIRSAPDEDVATPSGTRRRRRVIGAVLGIVAAAGLAVGIAVAASGGGGSSSDPPIVTALTP